MPVEKSWRQLLTSPELRNPFFQGQGGGGDMSESRSPASPRVVLAERQPVGPNEPEEEEEEEEEESL